MLILQGNSSLLEKPRHVKILINGDIEFVPPPLHTFRCLHAFFSEAAITILEKIDIFNKKNWKSDLLILLIGLDMFC